jgi:hypothetical protein
MRSIGYFILFWCASVSAFGQSLEQYNWYFGNSTQAIRFNRITGQPSLVTKAIPMGTGGSATATDPGNANLLFYTDGQLIYDAIHTRMPGGLGLTANTSANQPVAICPVPGAANKNKYFIFTNTASFTTGGTISVSVVDMALFGNAAFPSPPLGDIESKNLPTGLSNRSEGMILVDIAAGGKEYQIGIDLSADFDHVLEDILAELLEATHIVVEEDEVFRRDAEDLCCHFHFLLERVRWEVSGQRTPTQRERDIINCCAFGDKSGDRAPAAQFTVVGVGCQYQGAL